MSTSNARSAHNSRGRGGTLVVGLKLGSLTSMHNMSNTPVVLQVSMEFCRHCSELAHLQGAQIGRRTATGLWLCQAVTAKAAHTHHFSDYRWRARVSGHYLPRNSAKLAEVALKFENIAALKSSPLSRRRSSCHAGKDKSRTRSEMWHCIPYFGNAKDCIDQQPAVQMGAAKTRVAARERSRSGQFSAGHSI